MSAILTVDEDTLICGGTAAARMHHIPATNCAVTTAQAPLVVPERIVPTHSGSYEKSSIQAVVRARPRLLEFGLP
jgi:hypothetical protein